MRTARLAAGFVIAVALLGAANGDPDEMIIGARRNYWAVQKPVRPAVPSVEGDWVRTPVDAFILKALRNKALAPSPTAPASKLVRRLWLDTVGLPPDPGVGGSYEQLVDKLLASPHYGERMALKWLDVVRYADTNGFELDAERPQAWRYRDYVVDSFNRDKPYDRFIREQIAGDELYPGSHEGLVALGFLRAGARHVVGGNQDLEQNRQEDLTEMVAAVGSAFLGMTVQCARCHNHKFDPILQADYYRLQAVFAATEFQDTVEIASNAEKRDYEDRKKAFEAKLKPITDEIAAIEKPYRERLRAVRLETLSPALRAVLDIPKEQRSPEQKALAKDAESQISLSWDVVVGALSSADRERRATLRRQLHRLEYERPSPPPSAFAVANMSGEIPVTHVLKAGDPHQKLAAVDPGFVKVLAGGTGKVPHSAGGRRSALANWLASPDHPLTARVMVNRIWQMRMGTGLVASPNDFGLLGGASTPAENRALLDWLACEFVEHNWSVKHIDRLILLSNAYRQGTEDDAAKAKVDPDNRLYWRMNRKRLDAELLRDSVLQAAGTLNPKLGGPPVRVPIEPEVYDLIFTEGEPDNLWPVALDPAEHRRRSLYLLNKRTVRLPLLANFDQPDEMSSCPVRPASTHALQALSLFNSNFMQEQSKAFATRVVTACGGKRDCEVTRAYEFALGRLPLAAEKQMARRFFGRKGTLDDFCLALLNRNEFVYVP
jgi:hypothetical protein